MTKDVFVGTLFMHNLVVSLKAKLRIYIIYIYIYIYKLKLDPCNDNISAAVATWYGAVKFVVEKGMYTLLTVLIHNA